MTIKTTLILVCLVNRERREIKTTDQNGPNVTPASRIKHKLHCTQMCISFQLRKVNNENLTASCISTKHRSPNWQLSPQIYRLNPLTPKILMLILPSSCFTFPCKLVI